MYIHRALLSALLVMYIFTPSIQAWIMESGQAWYRPYLAWMGVILFVYWVQRKTSRKHYDI